MRISDWSSDVCSSDLVRGAAAPPAQAALRHGSAARLLRRRGPPAAWAVGRGRLPRSIGSARLRARDLRRRASAGLPQRRPGGGDAERRGARRRSRAAAQPAGRDADRRVAGEAGRPPAHQVAESRARGARAAGITRSEEHTSEIQSPMRISYAVFCLKKKNKTAYISKTRHKTPK